MTKPDQRGFTLTELLVGISIMCIILSSGCVGNFIKAKSKAKEAEAKANLHTIQIACERYNTDHHEYPPYLLGGDADGWLYWHSMWDEGNPDPEVPANAWVQDPLLEYNYIHSYPENPFVDAKEGKMIIRATSFEDDLRQGDADPRFGYKGNIMGMGLDDPNFFEDANPNLPYSRVETKRTLDRGRYDPTERGYPDKNSSVMPGLYYNFGGRYNPKTGKEVIAFWPGNFFYRSMVDIQPARSGYSWPYPNTNAPGHILRYMLGVWGSESNAGKDVIRLQHLTPDVNQSQIYWRMPPPWTGVNDYPCGYTGDFTSGSGLGLPAVFGGGDATLGPYWPADRDPENLAHFIYGAPDGVKDGVILVLNTGAEVHELLRPAEFVDESGDDILEDYDYPQFKNVFNSDLLPSTYSGNEYLITVKLDIDASGNLASEPRIVVSSGEKVVDDETIKRLKGLKYDPAVSLSTGDPVAAEVTAQIFWLPGGG